LRIVVIVPVIPVAVIEVVVVGQIQKWHDVLLFESHESAAVDLAQPPVGQTPTGNRRHDEIEPRRVIALRALNRNTSSST
jgi:hypothetical protein